MSRQDQYNTKQKARKIFWMCFWLNEECPKLHSSLEEKEYSIVRGKKEFFRASLYVWYLQYWALCDDLVDFKLWAGVRHLSFSIDMAPECVLWKKQGGPIPTGLKRWPLKLIKHLVSPTLLVFCHLYLINRKFSVSAARCKSQIPGNWVS